MTFSRTIQWIMFQIALLMNNLCSSCFLLLTPSLYLPWFNSFVVADGKRGKESRKNISTSSSSWSPSSWSLATEVVRWVTLVVEKEKCLNDHDDRPHLPLHQASYHPPHVCGLEMMHIIWDHHYYGWIRGRERERERVGLSRTSQFPGLKKDMTIIIMTEDTTCLIDFLVPSHHIFSLFSCFTLCSLSPSPPLVSFH